jgi:hypothetical protein
MAHSKTNTDGANNMNIIDITDMNTEDLDALLGYTDDDCGDDCDCCCDSPFGPGDDIAAAELRAPIKKRIVPGTARTEFDWARIVRNS